MYMFSNDANTGNRMGYCHWIYSFCPLDLTKLLRFWFKQLRVGGYESQIITARRASRAVQLLSPASTSMPGGTTLRIRTLHMYLYDELIPYSSDNMSHSC